MLFREILKVHEANTAAGGLPDILGDAFLRSVNPVYRRIMNRAGKIGTVFAETDALYLLMPFHQLDRIVASKTVPYVPHARLMSEIEARHPGVFGLQQMPMPESYHMHEAAHVIAADCCAKVEITSIQDRILKALISESFANTADAMACGYADTANHRLFLKLNCYMQPTTEAREVMTAVRETYGEAYTVRLILTSYLYANFLRDEVPAELLGAGIDDENCLALATVGQQLDLQFREHTTQNYFLLSGFEGEVLDLVNFDFMKLLGRPDFSAAFGALAAVLS
jgi:hypothetical protein